MSASLPLLRAATALALCYRFFLGLTLALRLAYFTPLLIVSYYRRESAFALALSLLIGLSIDLYSVELPFGIYALSYTLTTWLLYPQKRHLFEDSFSTLPILTFAFSCLSTAILIALAYLSSHAIELSADFLIADLFVLPLCDALYAFIFFTLFSTFSNTLARRSKRGR